MMIKAKKLGLRFIVSLASGVSTAFVVFIGCYAILMIVKEKRIADIKRHSENLAVQISELPSIRSYLLEAPGAPKKGEIENRLKILLGSDPFIEEITVIDRFQKMLFCIAQPRDELRDDPIERASISLHEVISGGQPIADERNLEYFIPLSLTSDTASGMLRVHWKPEAVVNFYQVLKVGIFYVAAGSFILAFLLSYFVLLRAYTMEYKRLARNLGLVGGNDYSQRLDIHQYWKDIVEIGVHINRILHDTEAEKNRTLSLRDMLGQAQKESSKHRKNLSVRTGEMERLRQEMQEGIVGLFEMMWNGVAVVDDEYLIHYSNERADHLLRFARIDESTIVDERLRRCLAPLLRLGTVNEVDDICAWPQPALGHTASCHIRASTIPSGEGERLFFLLLKEDDGYPEKHGATYFSERLVLDILMPSQEKDDGLFDPGSGKNMAQIERENRFCECLRRIESLYILEKGEFGPSQSIRLSSWLRERFKDDDLFSEYLFIDENTPDADIVLNVPELALAELLDNTIFILTRLAYENGETLTDYITLRSSVDARGKPVITFTLPNCTRRLASRIQHVLDERSPLHPEDELDKSLTIEELELEIGYSMFRTVKHPLRCQIECVFSDTKKVATYRMTIENHTFSNRKTDKKSSTSSKTDPDIFQTYLERA